MRILIVLSVFIFSMSLKAFSQKSMESANAGISKSNESSPSAVKTSDVKSLYNVKKEEFKKIEKKLTYIINHPNLYTQDPEMMKQEEPGYKHRTELITAYSAALKAKARELTDLSENMGLNNLPVDDLESYNRLKDLQIKN